MKNNARRWLLLITLVGIIIRLPYWEVIPASFDEVNQTVFALLIAQGRSFPLVANDAYTGPFYVYLLAGLLRLGITNPLLGRIVVMITGIATIPATYGWVRTLGDNKTAGLIAAMLVAINPDLILVNSHIGGATFLLPFFSTVFLLCLALAIRQDNFWWLIAGAIAAGLALQSNPIAGLLIMGGLLWLLWQTYRKPQLGKRWPFWPISAGFIILLVYSPVIIHNVTTDFQTVDVLQERSYLWEDNPTLDTTINNLRRFSLQTSRQVSGVITGDEQFSSLFGVPLIFVALMVIGLAYTSYYVSSLPVLVIAPFLVIFPIFSSHYGFISVGRFTTLLVPVWAAVIGFLLSAIINKVRQSFFPKGRIYSVLALVLALPLIVYPIRSLFQFYQSVNEAHESGSDLLELSRYVVAQNNGEPVYISTIDELSFLTGVPYVPHAAFLLADVYHEFLPPQQIVGRLFGNPGAAFLLLSDGDRDIVQKTAVLVRVDIQANEEASLRNYGLYKFEANTPLPKPDFVIRENDVSEEIAPAVVIGDGIQLLGCSMPQIASSGNELPLHCYWQAIGSMPHEEYVAFVHLFDPTTMTVVAQDDHILGQERYPLNAWQTGEVIKESYTIFIPENTTLDGYQVLVGIYTWPNLTRLNVPGNSDNVVVLPFADFTNPD